MPRYKVTLQAKNLAELVKMNPKAESIELLEESEGTANTHAIGFEIRPGNEYDSADE